MLEPVIKELRVAAPPAAAFEQFTRGMGDWWPLRRVSVFEEQSVGVRFEEWEGGGLVELSGQGQESDWGQVLEWQPPERVVFSWHPGRPTGTAQRVEVRVVAVEGGALIRLEHSEWETLGDAAAETRSRYQTGWDGVLENFRQHVAVGPAEASRRSTAPPARAG